MKKLAILGSTGSIGQSTLSICESFPDRYEPVALAAGRNVDEAFAQCLRWRPQIVSLATEEHADALTQRLKAEGIATLSNGIEVVYGTAGSIRVATLPEADFVVSAIVGVAGLEATYAAVCAGKTIGLANKECLVAAGDLILSAARKHDVALLPIDSEHNAVHQCLRGGTAAEVKQIWLTASGGPFRNTPLAEFANITPAQALKHPTWVMGQRITIDSATMMNKGFEIIEACRLFDLPPAQVRVTVHPQSTVHSLVEFIDGSILAQISVTDMRLPILYALAYPERPAAPQLSFDLAALSRLDFAPPDFARFPCLRLAYEAAESGPAACIALNAADEIAVAAFLEGAIPFLGIPRTIEEVLMQTKSTPPESIEEVLAADAAARDCARKIVAGASFAQSSSPSSLIQSLSRGTRLATLRHRSIASRAWPDGLGAEFGHFAVAKLCGRPRGGLRHRLRQRLVGCRRGETEYQINSCPYGRAYVKNGREIPGEAVTNAPAS